ncbi:MAG: hypothetical protein JXL84_16585 [Deltaproteobacteria bacterium]|nr:hypothetical protein [Deltaproteobacteria bacterium]
MGFSLSEFKDRYRARIIREWVDRLKTQVGEQYAGRPKKELYGTVTEALDADFDLLVHGDYGPIDLFIDKITRLRLASGFLLSDVQKAFELFRIISVPGTCLAFLRHTHRALLWGFPLPPGEGSS